MMKRLAIVIGLVACSALGLAAQAGPTPKSAQGPAPKKGVWQYGTFVDVSAGSGKSFYNFASKTGKKGSGRSLEEVLKTYTGGDFTGESHHL
jgi:hypothetical protein